MKNAILAVGAAFALSGCVETTEEIIRDPGAFECRERGASLMNVSRDSTSANPVNFDAFGNRNYNVIAGGVIFRCTVNSDDVIVSFSRA